MAGAGGRLSSSGEWTAAGDDRRGAVDRRGDAHGTLQEERFGLMGVRLIIDGKCTENTPEKQELEGVIVGNPLPKMYIACDTEPSLRMTSINLAIAWNWEFDRDFILGIERECSSRGLSTYRVEDHNIVETVRLLTAGALSFGVFFDRASDADEKYLALQPFVDRPPALCINPRRLVLHAADKATMHLELITHGVYVPNTIILPPVRQRKELEISQADIDRIGIPFVVKPANTTGGGTGVIMNAATLARIAEARLDHPGDKYLVQETIHPILLDGTRAWFRVYHAFGTTILCWWDDRTHQYREVDPEEEAKYGLGGLRHVMEIIRRACRLDFFSSEIAITAERKFIVVDYVNEVCDMRRKSRFENGAPDAVVSTIARLLADRVADHSAATGERTGTHD
jgi:hypothetical protein